MTRLALAAPDVPTAVEPILASFVDQTAADGSAYFQLDGLAFHARAASGRMPSGPAMETILTHGLPADTPLMRALTAAEGPLFFDDTGRAPATAGFPELGVASLAAAPVRDRAGALLGGFLMHTFNPHTWTPAEADLVAAVSGALAALTARLIAEEAAVAAREGALRALGRAIELRDQETKGHTERVTALALRLGAALGLAAAEIEELRWGAYLHDVGKLSVSDTILRHPGQLEPDAWEGMKAHAALGHAFASELAFLPAGALAIVRHHHERWDGTGYPDGLRGEAIPRLARIFALYDTFDALTSARPYKAAWTPAAARTQIAAQVGRQFDPAMVAAFLALPETA